jgi:hypothetical protein
MRMVPFAWAGPNLKTESKLTGGVGFSFIIKDD